MLLNSLSDSGLAPRLEHTIKAVKSQKGLCRRPSADANKSLAILSTETARRLSHLRPLDGAAGLQRGPSTQRTVQTCNTCSRDAPSRERMAAGLREGDRTRAAGSLDGTG